MHCDVTLMKPSPSLSSHIFKLNLIPLPPPPFSDGSFVKKKVYYNGSEPFAYAAPFDL